MKIKDIHMRYVKNVSFSCHTAETENGGKLFSPPFLSSLVLFASRARF